jgi:hypothetical protein
MATGRAAAKSPGFSAAQKPGFSGATPRGMVKNERILTQKSPANSCRRCELRNA